MKKALSLTLALLLVLTMFAGCSNGDADSTDVPDDATASPKPSENVQDEETVPAIEFPLADPIELTLWHTFDSTIIASMSDSKFTSEVADRLGINLKWEEASSASAAETFSLLMVSEDLPDLIKPPQTGMAAIGGSGDAAIANGICIPINDLSQYYPVYQSYIDNSDDISKLTQTDSGNMWGFHVILKEPEGPWTGMAYRKDIAEQAGYTKSPVTIADWEEMLTAMRDYGVESPLSIPESGLWQLGSPLMSAYDISYDWFVKDGEVRFSYTEDSFKDYLALMNKWYTDKLIDQDFIGRQGNVMSILSEEYFRTDVGAMQSVFSFTRNAMYASYGFTDESDFWLEPVGAPVLNEGDTLHINYPMTYVQNLPLMISTSNEYPEISCKFADYFYTDEGFILANYGIEGESFYWDDDYPRATDALLNDPQGREFTRLKAKWCWLQGVGLYTYLQSKDDMADPAVYDAYDIWNNGDGAWNYPSGATLTVEEGASYSSAFADIETFSSEMVVKFIIGQEPLDNFDQFVNEIKAMGIDECTEIKQESYDRYMAR